MPEILTKHPGIVKDILNSSKDIECGKLGVKPQILKKCPAKQFCTLPQGELCIYDYRDIDKMTQLSRDDLLNNRKGRSSGRRCSRCSICKSTTHIKSNKKYHPY